MRKKEREDGGSFKDATAESNYLTRLGVTVVRRQEPEASEKKNHGLVCC